MRCGVQPQEQAGRSQQCILLNSSRPAFPAPVTPRPQTAISRPLDDSLGDRLLAAWKLHKTLGLLADVFRVLAGARGGPYHQVDVQNLENCQGFRTRNFFPKSETASL